jgi:hypothetical protein
MRSHSRRSTGLRGRIAHKCWCGAGLQEHWQHQWRYDGNGQPWITLQGRWWQMHRATGTKARVLLQDSESLLRPAQTYLFVPPRSWPLEEVRAAPASAWNAQIHMVALTQQCTIACTNRAVLRT